MQDLKRIFVADVRPASDAAVSGVAPLLSLLGLLGAPVLVAFSGPLDWSLAGLIVGLGLCGVAVASGAALEDRARRRGYRARR